MIIFGRGVKPAGEFALKPWAYGSLIREEGMNNKTMSGFYL